ncbi:COG3660 Predicted nucleoside-diphosphate-sugar epimerase [Rhabdaerophilaceae bacterium]
MLSSPEIRSLDDARAALAKASCWIITDGKMGDRAHCLGIAERLHLAAEDRVVAPRPPFTWLMPWGGIDPREALSRVGSPLAPPFPDLAIGSGRRAAPYLRHLKSASGGRVFTAFLKDPRSGTRTADFLWVPEHDRLRGANVCVTLTSPHRISPEKLAAARAANAPWGTDARPIVGLVLGGNSKDFQFSAADEARLVADMLVVIQQGWRLAATPSRRTPASLVAAISQLALDHNGYCWGGAGENPYLAILAHADALIVTADSVNMVGEAVATGTPVYIARPSGGSRKIEQFLIGLDRLGAVRPFQAALERFTYGALDSTPTIAIALAQGYVVHRRRIATKDQSP